MVGLVVIAVGVIGLVVKHRLGQRAYAEMTELQPQQP